MELTGSGEAGSPCPTAWAGAGPWDPEPGWTPSQCWVFSCGGAALGTERVKKRKQPRIAHLKKPHRNQIGVERCRNAGRPRHEALTDGRRVEEAARPGQAPQAEAGLRKSWLWASRASSPGLCPEPKVTPGSWPDWAPGGQESRAARVLAGQAELQKLRYGLSPAYTRICCPGTFCVAIGPGSANFELPHMSTSL